MHRREFRASLVKRVKLSVFFEDDDGLVLQNILAEERSPTSWSGKWLGLLSYGSLNEQENQRYSND